MCGFGVLILKSSAWEYSLKFVSCEKPTRETIRNPIKKRSCFMFLLELIWLNAFPLIGQWASYPSITDLNGFCFLTNNEI